jgi:hypothetical protein
MRQVYIAVCLHVAMLLVLAPAQSADSTVDVTVELLIEMMRQFGSYEGQSGTGDDLILIGTLEEGQYTISPADCAGYPSCGSVMFYETFDKGGATTQSVNRWNRKQPFGNLHIIKDSLVLALWFPTPDGLPRRTLERYFDVWKKLLKDVEKIAGSP